MRWLQEPDLRDPIHFLDDISSRLEAGEDVAGTMKTLCDGLWWLRRHWPGEEWVHFCAVARQHRLAALVHQDPFTHRSFAKPRGYPGDANLIDMIYYDQGVADLGSPTPLGLKIFDSNKDSTAPAAVRERRDFAARLIDETCSAVNGGAILSVAGGHARELSLSAAVRQRAFGRMVVLDQDADSLEIVRREYASLGVETHAAKVTRLLAAPELRASFDLVYSAGLYDYLQDQLAERLTAAMFSLLRPGGRLIIGNFVPGIYDAGYMESYMDWWLIYRDGGQMTALAASLPQADVSSVRTYTLSHTDVVYLEVRRRRQPLVAVSSPPTRQAAAGVV
ncbi:MAG: class I SAM-dependent methyltransferase [Gemmatimonadales bacterium]